MPNSPASRFRTAITSRAAVTLSAIAAMAAADAASAQFSGPLVTNTRIRYVGSLLTEPGQPPPEEGDQIGVFFGEDLIGRYTFTLGQLDPIAFAFFASEIGRAHV